MESLVGPGNPRSGIVVCTRLSEVRWHRAPLHLRAWSWSESAPGRGGVAGTRGGDWRGMVCGGREGREGRGEGVARLPWKPPARRSQLSLGEETPFHRLVRRAEEVPAGSRSLLSYKVEPKWFPWGGRPNPLPCAKPRPE